MAAQQTQGIQTLLEAEKEAAKVVQQARQHRVQRLKDARAEANREVEEYKRQKEQEYKAFESKHAGSTQYSQSRVDKETDAKIAAIESAYQGRKEAVVQLLLDRVVLVKPELHRNLKTAES
ncbi:V-type ATPase [Gautieria morchelliformis]|nr:V-type ATPase [Gautieria morchelliformis]